MSGLFGALNGGVKALAAHSRAVETAGRNLANVNNPDYARQRVVYGDRGTVLTPLGAQSLGIEAKQVEQIRDRLLDQQVVREVAVSSAAEAEANAYAKGQAALGQSIDRTADSSSSGSSGSQGVVESVTDFFTAFEGLAARPTDSGQRQTLMQRAAILTDRLNSTDARLDQLEKDLTSAAASDVEDVNRLLTVIGELNGQIGRFEINAPGSAVDLRDQRQARLEELAGKIGIETRANAVEPGQIDIFARDGAGNEIQLINLATVPNPVVFDGTNLTVGPDTIALSSGSIAGHLKARDQGLTQLRNDLDALANELVTSVNAAYNPTGLTGDFFVAGGTTAGSIKVDPTVNAVSLKASDGGAAGDATIARAIADLAYRNFNTGGGDAIDGTFNQFLSRSISDFGEEVAGADARFDDQNNIEKLVRAQRDSVSGVSLDEEMADLLKFQRAFQASSRVISVVDELLNTVVNGLGR
ncbi:flagellar hook-associated protein FlgK [Actomonas aquatica]|uniref:Flagellar hook-associated protein 1 n=1 Tax=Actomonas aquatica TaxID=2866162 RepID=A0ABZ1C8L3_9BACT|nr:flagellar hook-associated protein FlgK [Opitutus sp. WL0086]WRQ87608.1 flagellar hook-associated protein FlgK [Opitutus sp. WL0086]